MKVSTVLKGAAAIAAVGTVAYMVSNSSPRTKRKIKKTTEKAMHSVGNAFSDMSAMM